MLNAWWDKLWTWFNNSGTILWARLQLVVGAIWAVLLTSDLSPIISGKWLTYWLIFSGVISELVRRSGTYVNSQSDLVSKG